MVGPLRSSKARGIRGHSESLMLGKLWRVLQAKLKELEECTLVSYTPPKLFTCCQRHMHAPQPRPRRLSWSSPPSPAALVSRPSGANIGWWPRRARPPVAAAAKCSSAPSFAGGRVPACPGAWGAAGPGIYAAANVCGLVTRLVSHCRYQYRPNIFQSRIEHPKLAIAPLRATPASAGSAGGESAPHFFAG